MKNPFAPGRGILLALTVGLCVRLPAQSYLIDWHKVAGGGGTSSGGAFVLSGTIGQHDAGSPLGGGNFRLTGGYWSLISAAQTIGAPTLRISHSGSTVIVYWQDVGSWTLEQSGDISTTNGWSNSVGVTTANGTNYWSITNPVGNQFFRLH